MTNNIEALPTLLLKVREASVVSMRSTLSKFDLTEQQWRVIDAVAEGEINAKDIAEKTAILAPSISRILNTLEAGGILKRKASTLDKRWLNVSLTNKGKRLHKKISPKVTKSFESFSGLVSENKFKQLDSLLKSILREAA